MTFRKNGFTLIELVVVIIILAVLAVIAAPKFLDINSDARQSMLKGAAAELQQAMSFAHQKWAIEGRANEARLDMPGYADNNLDMNDVGYPLGIDKSPALSAPYNIGRNHKACRELWETLLTSSLTVTENAGSATDFDFFARRDTDTFVTPDGQIITALSKCYYIYTQDGFSTTPQDATHVIWYDSRTGDVSYVYQG